ncbi:MAG: MBL fold metallo-hydrolase [Elusimicrobia bacterium]|nr:MBL fold metallo-hydrolase [Elusimicrobiota bacterium]
MIFHVLGSGAFAPEPGQRRRAPGRGGSVRNPAGYALDTGRGVLLFDFGFGSLRQLYRAGLESRRVSHAFFTHRHPDHVGDLAALLFQLRYDAKPDSGVLRLFGPRGFAAFCKRLARAYEPWTDPKGFRLLVRELRAGDSVEGAGWRVACRAVPHPTEALAFRLDGARRSLCYTGDTGYDPGLAEFARGADLLVLECSLPDGARAEGHLNVSEALRIASGSGARRVLLSHLSGASARGAAGRLPRGVRLARDLMRVRL